MRFNVSGLYFGNFRLSCHLMMTVCNGYWSISLSWKPCAALFIQLGLMLQKIIVDEQ
jgi:hypothetical protein